MWPVGVSHKLIVKKQGINEICALVSIIQISKHYLYIL